ncbi:MAG TPA: hypothetical protein VFJ13_00355 [Paracoccaceae bacterium]|nr:hypothetical protein [Paracoccaceae bacterium]
MVGSDCDGPRWPMADPLDQMAVDHAAEAVTEAAAGTGVPAGEVTITVVPHQHRPEGPTPQSVLARFAAQLDWLIDEAFASPPGDDPPRDETPEEPLLNAACALCRGWCCLSGLENHAHLKLEDVRRYRRRDPGATPAEVRAAYFAHLPAESVLLSCVYHGKSGCTLPRRLRNKLCNDFHCRGQRLLTEGRDAGHRAAVLVTSWDNRSASVASWTPDAGLVTHRANPESSVADAKER